MQRREFIGLVGGAAVAWSHGAQAQRQAIPLIGYAGISRGSTTVDQAFREGLAEMGFTDGQNVAIEYRWTDGHLERLPKLMVDLVRRPVSAIFSAGGDVSTLIAKGATRSIPIIFLTASDPVRSGLVASLNRPSQNATGVTMLAGPLGAKRLQLLRELVPNTSAFGLLVNPNNTNSELESADVQTGGRTIGLQTHLLEASTSEEVDKAFASLAELKASALVVNADPLFIQLRSQLIALAARYSVPTIYYAREFPENGGLISYGASIAIAMRQCGNYVGRILKGENPSDLPVVQPTKFELVINLKTAQAVGLTVPTSLLTRADEVIE